jgi:hypothetical protein
MRAMECPLENHHLVAEKDEEQFEVTRKHADEILPEQGLTDESKKNSPFS